MKGEKEGGEKKGKEGEKRKGGKGEKKTKKTQSSTAGLKPTTFHSAASCLWLPPGGKIAHRYVLYMYISQILILMT